MARLDLLTKLSARFRLGGGGSNLDVSWYIADDGKELANFGSRVGSVFSAIRRARSPSDISSLRLTWTDEEGGRVRSG